MNRGRPPGGTSRPGDGPYDVEENGPGSGTGKKRGGMQDAAFAGSGANTKRR